MRCMMRQRILCVVFLWLTFCDGESSSQANVHNQLESISKKLHELEAEVSNLIVQISPNTSKPSGSSEPQLKNYTLLQTEVSNVAHVIDQVLQSGAAGTSSPSGAASGSLKAPPRHIVYPDPVPVRSPSWFSLKNVSVTVQDALQYRVPLELPSNSTGNGKCDPACGSIPTGYCHPELGRCDCIYGYTGPACLHEVAPACRIPAGPKTPAPVRRPCMLGEVPTSCECKAQCSAAALDKYLGSSESVLNQCEDRSRTACFRGGTGPVPTRNATMYRLEGDTAGVQNVHGRCLGSELEAAQAAGRELALEEVVEPELLEELQQMWRPEEECNAGRGCSGRGYCNPRAPHPKTGDPMCTCFRGFIGSMCQVESDWWCWGRCNGHGRCIQGTCICDEGYFGLDCSARMQGGGEKERVAPRPMTEKEDHQVEWYRHLLYHGEPTSLPPSRRRLLRGYGRFKRHRHTRREEEPEMQEEGSEEEKQEAKAEAEVVEEKREGKAEAEVVEREEKQPERMPEGEGGDALGKGGAGEGGGSGAARENVEQEGEGHTAGAVAVAEPPRQRKHGHAAAAEAWPPDHPLDGFKVYVYDLPPPLNTWGYANADVLEQKSLRVWWYDEEALGAQTWVGPGVRRELRGPYQGHAPQAFLAALLRTRFRTLDPDDADYFVIPSWDPTLHEAAVNYVRARWPFWNATGGRDHMLAGSNEDRGTCAWSRLLKQSIMLTPFACFCDRPECMEACGGMEACFDPAKDIAIAPLLPAPRQRVLAAAGPADPRITHRETFFFFAGAGVEEDAARSQLEDKTYFTAGQVRQAVYAYHGHRDGWEIHRDVGAAELEYYDKSVFCLAPNGFGWGSRLYHMLGSGCIPVIIQDDIWQPGQVGGLLDYSQFSVVLQSEAIPRLHELLQAIPEARRHSLAYNSTKMWLPLTWKAAVPADWVDKVEAAGVVDQFELILATLKAKKVLGDESLSAAQKASELQRVRAYVRGHVETPKHRPCLPLRGCAAYPEAG